MWILNTLNIISLNLFIKKIFQKIILTYC
jgi:hypothetical protein